ncbi:hypothetical protein FAK_24110 [Desulfoferula mesophila]|uniref:Uncharacterized protein n=1 Tax=Desulfoferula mesophila TaxID=3058419 RepID=A0AAU9EF00_9BACT|nr:hypothetical protein FAK_24110 [Desulfoferula mesophilus]
MLHQASELPWLKQTEPAHEFSVNIPQGGIAVHGLDRGHAHGREAKDLFGLFPGEHSRAVRSRRNNNPFGHARAQVKKVQLPDPPFGPGELCKPKEDPTGLLVPEDPVCSLHGLGEGGRC